MFKKTKQATAEASGSVKKTGRTIWLLLAVVFVIAAGLFFFLRFGHIVDKQNVQRYAFEDFSIVMDSNVTTKQVNRQEQKRFYTFNIEGVEAFFDVYASPINTFKLYGEPLNPELTSLSPEMAEMFAEFDLENAKFNGNYSILFNDGEYVELLVDHESEKYGKAQFYIQERLIIHDGWIYIFRLMCTSNLTDSYQDRFSAWLSSIQMT